MKLYHYQKVAHLVHYTSDMSSNLEKFMDMAAKGAYQLLQHYVCRDYKTSQRGNGMGGVHHRHNAHRLYLIPKMDEIEDVNKPSEKPSSKCDKVEIKMISPAQATVERAESEAKHLKANSHKRNSQSLGSAPPVHYSGKPKKRKTVESAPYLK